MWLPVACVAVAVGFAAYARRRLAGPGARAAALALALFYFTPLLPLLDWGGIASALTANQLVVVAGAAAPFWGNVGLLLLGHRALDRCPFSCSGSRTSPRARIGPGRSP